MTGLPAWVADKIATTTGLDPRLGRRPRATICRRCQAPVLHGLDGERCALQVDADPTLLTNIGELLALLAGRATFDLDSHPPQLTHRHRWRIRGHPADTNTVIPEHTCGAAALPNRPPEPPPPRTVRGKDTDDEPPF